jgi:hypothetical protein
MAARARERRGERLPTAEEILIAAGNGESVPRWRETEALIAVQRAERPERFAAEAPDDGTCRDCHTWRIESPRMGRYAWWSTCRRDPCPCCHCEQIVWRA